MRPKNNKTADPDGLPAELFKTGSNGLVGLCRITADNYTLLKSA